MRLFVTALVFLIGLFMILIAMSVLFQPVTTAPSLLGITPEGTHAMSTLRGDVQAFFSIIGITMLWGAWKRSGDLLLVPAAVMAIAVTVRGLSLAIDGTYPGWQAPMLVEALHVALLAAAWRVLPHHRIEELTS